MFFLEPLYLYLALFFSLLKSKTMSYHYMLIHMSKPGPLSKSNATSEDVKSEELRDYHPFFAGGSANKTVTWRTI